MTATDRQVVGHGQKPAGDSRSQEYWSVFAITYHQFVSSMWQVRILNYITLSIPIIHPRFDFWCSSFWLQSCSLFTACIRPLKHEFWCKTSLSISCPIAHVVNQSFRFDKNNDETVVKGKKKRSTNALKITCTKIEINLCLRIYFYSALSESF